jgi:hypothetical protein
MPLYRGTNYADDRLYVLELRKAGPNTDGKPWLLVTRDNIVDQYPPYRVDEFDTYEEAHAYKDRIFPHTPMISLDCKAPSPPPTVKELDEWIAKVGMRPNYDEEAKTGEPFYHGDVEVDYVSADGSEPKRQNRTDNKSRRQRGGPVERIIKELNE